MSSSSRQRLSTQSPSISHTNKHVNPKDDDDIRKSMYRLPLTSTLSYKTCFLMLASVRILCAVLLPISDCDEVYNYYEPMHFLQHNRGFQTWEYAPQYSLRSYLYICIHKIIITIATYVSGFSNDMPFFIFRAILGVFLCASCEAYFITSIGYLFGPVVASSTLLFLCFSPGMSHASISFLPSSSAMYLFTVGSAFWLHTYRFDISIYQRTNYLFYCILCIAIGCLWTCWPFVCVAALPIAVDAIIRIGFQKFILWIVSIGICLILPAVIIDFNYYDEFIYPPLMIMLYNLPASLGGAGGQGSAIYGVEPWTFYVKNLFLNFNILSIFSVLCPLILKFSASQKSDMTWKRRLGFITPMFLWLSFMLALPHKEERFLYVIYPHVCLAAALCVGAIWSQPPRRTWRLVTVLSFFIIFIALSCSRHIAVISSYRGSLDVYQHLSRTTPSKPSATETLCLGKEWYRFPSHYLIPSHINVAFIQSNFTGHLPQLYPSWDEGGTRLQRLNFNDRNEEDISRYVNINTCDLIIDYEPRIADDGSDCAMMASPCRPAFPWLKTFDSGDWSVVYESPFLDANATGAGIYRSFYIPGWSDARWKFGKYLLLKRNK